MLSVYKTSSDKLTQSSLNVLSFATVMEKDIDPEKFKSNYSDYFKMMISIEKELIEKLSLLEIKLKDKYSNS